MKVHAYLATTFDPTLTRVMCGRYVLPEYAQRNDEAVTCKVCRKIIGAN